MVELGDLGARKDQETSLKLSVSGPMLFGNTNTLWNEV